MGENIFLQHMNKVVIHPQKIYYILSSTFQYYVKKLTTNKDLTNSVPNNIQAT